MSRPSFRVVVPPGGEVELADALARFVPHAAEALADGRVFIDGRRASDADAAVPAGTVVEVYARRAESEGVEILATHAGLVFVAKPPGVATEPDHSGVEDCLVSRVERLLGAVRGELHALSRLDVGVSGVVTLARDAAARGLVEDLRARGRFGRRYIALAGGVPTPESGAWSAPIGRQPDGRRRIGGTEAKNATTRYATIARAAQGDTPGSPGAALLVLSPLTGRTHQLRVHAAGAGVALLGDRAYGGVSRVRLPSGRVSAVSRPALHALWVELALEAGPLRVEAPVPEDFVTLWSELGGERSDIDRAGDAAV